MSYSIGVNYGKADALVLNLFFGEDGSVYLTDLINRHFEKPGYDILTADFPVARTPDGNKTVQADKKHYYADHLLKFSHHPSGFFQISGQDGSKVISGIDDKTGLPRGIAVDAFKLKSSTTDGGAFLTATLWGVHHLEKRTSKKSQEIIFTEREIDYQGMNNSGSKRAFAFMFFHLPISSFTNDQLQSDWVYYDYRTHFEKPLLLRLFKDAMEHGYLVGVSCLNARCDFREEVGVAMMGGVGLVDPHTGTCRSIIVVSPRSKEYSPDAEYASLNKQSIE